MRAKLVNLQELDLSACQISQISPTAFRQLTNLVSLDLSQNGLEAVPTSALDEVTQLMELKLSHNPIGVIPNLAFLNLPYLKRLELTATSIFSLQPQAFGGLGGLEILKLDQNRLTGITTEILSPLKGLHSLNIHQVKKRTWKQKVIKSFEPNASKVCLFCLASFSLHRRTAATPQSPLNEKVVTKVFCLYSQNPWNCTCHLRPARQWLLKFNIPSSVPPSCAEPARIRGKAWPDLRLDDFACPPSQIKVWDLSKIVIFCIF